jgi:hypothetical protein
MITTHPESRAAELGRELLKAGAIIRRRRAAVLSHPDLAARLTEHPLNFTRPERWNGYIPPRIWPVDSDDGEPGGGEILRSVKAARNGVMIVRYNQRGMRSCGSQVNTAPQRQALLEIAAEAWRRQKENAAPGS